MKCAICGIEVETIEEAIDQCWIPSFYDETDNVHEPACSDCTSLFLTCSQDGKWEVREEFRGKLKYLDGQATQADSEDLPIEIRMRE